MRYRPLGRTGLEISEVSIGLEWLYKKAKENTIEVIREALNYGVNYFDVIFNMEDALEDVSDAIKNAREKIVLTHHLGSYYKGDKYQKTRSVKKCEEVFERFLEIMDTKFVDIGFIHFVLNSKQYEECCKEGGILDLALRLKEEGRIRHIGLSTHNVNVAIKAAESGKIDVIMVQINLANHALERRNEMLQLCKKLGVAIIAMKPFAGGKLLQTNKTVNFGRYLTAGHPSKKKKMSDVVSSTRCLHYVLSQVGVVAAVPGVSSVDELDDCMKYFTATDEQKDYSELLKDFKDYKTGECVYCNHCQPCQADIDIGVVNRLLDRALFQMTPEVRQEYQTLAVKADACIKCGDCLDRCPFEVKVISRMEKAVATFK